MALQGPIIIIEDDENDAEVMTAAIREIGIPNEIKVMNDADDAYNYLCTTTDRPFIIISDIKMPRVHGLDFRRRIMETEYLRSKSIPFVFYTGMVSEAIVNEAYKLDVQGFFAKARSYDAVREQLLTIFLYWKASLHPNNGSSALK